MIFKTVSRKGNSSYKRLVAYICTDPSKDTSGFTDHERVSRIDYLNFQNSIGLPDELYEHAGKLEEMGMG